MKIWIAAALGCLMGIGAWAQQETPQRVNNNVFRQLGQARTDTPDCRLTGIPHIVVHNADETEILETTIGLCYVSACSSLRFPLFCIPRCWPTL